MIRIAKLFILMFSFSVFSVFSASSASELTEEVVGNLISKVDVAVNTLNVQGVADTLSSDVEIIIHVNYQGQNQVIKPSKEEYLAMLQQGWALFTNYEYSKSNLVIVIQENRAFVTADVKESMTVQGQNISGQSKEEVTVEIVNGVPLVTKVTGYTSM